MATSQLIYYTSADVGGPGPLTGQTGSLLTVLDACLVNGYAGHPAAGWTKPFVNSASAAAYKIPSGSQCTMFVNDSGYQATALGREASITGWESMTNLSSSVVGGGVGQFPIPSQLLTTGRVICRKSSVADATARAWFMYADAYTMYLFTVSQDAVSGYGGLYHTLVFGDIFALRGTADAYRCMIYGSIIENSGQWWSYNNYVDLFDFMYFGQSSGATVQYTITSGQPGHYMPRTFGGLPLSINVIKYGDTSKTYQLSRNLYNGNSYYMNGFDFTGGLPCPNPADQSLYLAPVLIGETNGVLRGRMRGFYFLQHAPGNFGDGQIFQGSGDYAGKTFQVVKNCGPFNNAFCIEISSTVETN
jgi:hypothetical protein